MDEGAAVDIMYLDFQKAFDKVPHGRLICKIREAGVGGKLGDWIENWLANREQRVVINGSKSEWAEVTSGVPQGSILGPLLFTVYINDLDEGLKNKILKFADDTKIWGRVNSKEEVLLMQEDLKKLSEWSEKNAMPFNVTKCKVMHVGRKNPRQEYILKGQILSSIKEEKDLGVFFSESFKPTLNCNKVSKSANKVIGLIRRNIVNKTAEGMLILYKTLVRPIIDYWIPVWRPFTKKDIGTLEKIQKKFTKMIVGCKSLSYEQRLKKLSLTSLEQRHIRADLIQAFKVLNDKKGLYPANFLTLVSRAGRGNSLKLYKKRNSLELTRQRFTPRVVYPWNNLPDEVVLSADVSDFKSRLDYHMRGVRGQIQANA